MAISRGKALLNLSNPDPNEIAKSITALKFDADYIRKCIKAGLRDYDSGQKTINEISNLIQQLEQKLCMTDPNKPTPEQQNLPADDENTSTKRGFFDRIQQILTPKKFKPIYPSEAKEIVIMEDEDEDEDE